MSGSGYEMLCHLELKAGNRLIRPGDFLWLPKKDWPDDIVISLAPFRAVRIVAIYTDNPGKGAFSRLITGICRDDRLPLIVAPMGETMDKILEKWKWVVSNASDRVWMPPLGWTVDRAQENRRDIR